MDCCKPGTGRANTELKKQYTPEQCPEAVFGRETDKNCFPVEGNWKGVYGTLKQYTPEQCPEAIFGSRADKNRFQIEGELEGRIRNLK
ncbi:MAG: hypothetical protein K2O03_01850 [Lachnospiraceae bacterium]|nr:hypothetical protein [Lachnospiraceae bacterium]